MINILFIHQIDVKSLFRLPRLIEDVDKARVYRAIHTRNTFREYFFHSSIKHFHSYPPNVVCGSYSCFRAGSYLSVPLLDEAHNQKKEMTPNA